MLFVSRVLSKYSCVTLPVGALDDVVGPVVVVVAGTALSLEY